jgi:hypothetical protein
MEGVAASSSAAIPASGKGVDPLLHPKLRAGVHERGDIYFYTVGGGTSSEGKVFRAFDWSSHT